MSASLPDKLRALAESHFSGVGERGLYASELRPLIEALVRVAGAARQYRSGQSAPSQICTLDEVRVYGEALDSALAEIARLVEGK